MDLPNSIKDTIHVVDLTSDSPATPSTDQENVACTFLELAAYRHFIKQDPD